MNIKHLIVLLLLCCSTWGQQHKKLLTGIIQNKIETLSGTHIVNKNDNKATYTIDDGSFQIYTAINDTLEISHIGYKTKKIVINPTHLGIKKFNIQLEREVVELDEILLKKHSLTGSLSSDIKEVKHEKQINAKTLELPNAYNRKLTQPERKLYTAKSTNLYLILNTINGKIKLLKKEIKEERNQKKINAIRESNASLIKQLGIDSLEVDRFIYFITLDSNFNSVYGQSNFISFLIEQSKLYKQLKNK